ncbi:unnamed protein product, partial [Symbiodinium necroappetens]
SVESWGRLEVGSGEDVFVAQEDVRDFFYRLGISKDLGEYFSLPAVDPGHLQKVLGYLPLELEQLVQSHSGGAPGRAIGRQEVRATPHRDWRLDRALAALSTRLWKSVADELDMFRHLAVLGVSDFKSPWSQEVLCTDASLSGYAVMSRSASPEVVGELGRHDERWRFRLGDAKHVAPRASALALDPFSDPASVKPEVEGEIFGPVSVDDSFPQIKQSFMEPGNWHRWVVSEMNVADKDSRAWEPPKTTNSHGDFKRTKESCAGVLEGRSGSGQSEGSCERPGHGAQHLQQEERPCGNGADEESIQASGVGVEAKRKRAADRQKKFELKLRATQGERSILELSSVKEPQRRDYAKKLDGFYGFVAQHQLQIADTKALDAALCDWADILYLNGEGCNYGDKLLAALEFERPEFAREGKVHLPRYRRALKGWRRMAPTQTRLPMIEFIKGAISGVLLKRGRRSMALFNEVTFSTYARPGELLRVCAEDFVKPNQDQNHAVIVLSPLERGESSK